MARINKTPAHSAFESAVKSLRNAFQGVTGIAQLPRSLPVQTKYPLNTASMGTNLCTLSQGWLLAALMYGTNSEEAPASPLLTTPFCMVASQSIAGGNAVASFTLEMVVPTGTLYLTQTGGKMRGTIIDSSDATLTDPLGAFNTLSPDVLAAVGCALLPTILEVDAASGAGMIGDAITSLRSELQDMHTWSDPNDIPELTKEHIYCLDNIGFVLNSLSLDFADGNSASMEEPVGNIPMTRGAVVCCNMVNGWTPRFVQSNGKRFASTTRTSLTIADAKQMFSHYSANRHWTDEERMMIPVMPDDMPVMPEVLKMAKRITDTHDSRNPVVNMMWRSETGYGKSTGTRQLAAILNLPLLIMTCHPGMELQDFKSNFVPYTEDGAVSDTGRASLRRVSAPAASRTEHFIEAKQHLLSLPDSERSRILDAAEFFTDAFNEDPTDLMEKLTGQRINCLFTEVCTLYAEVRSSILYEDALEQKVQRLEAAAERNSGSKQETGRPEFVHVVANYVKALVNGYLCEIQEPSRIRDSGTLVGLNEFNRPDAVIPLMNGAYALRHKDAICVFTDNVGYGASRS